jgi:sugar lactone lactonase YvrE
MHHSHRNHLLAGALLAVMLSGCGGDGDPVSQGLLDAEGTRDPWLVQYLVSGADFLGVHGLTFDAEDNLYVGSVIGQTIHRVDTVTGEAEVFVGPPEGMADDLEFGPDGTLVWTSILTGKVHARSPDGSIRVLAEDLPGINSVAFDPDGRLFVTQVLWGDALWELDPKGEREPRQVIADQGHLNGFDFSRSGELYGPLLYKGKVVRVDVDSGELATVASGFRIPVAVNLDSRDNLYVPDTALGRIVRVDIDNGEKTLVASLAPGIDNLALDSRDRLFVTNMVDNAILQVNTRTGATRTLTRSALAVPGGIDVVRKDGVDQVYLADLFSFKRVDGDSGAVTELKRGLRDRLEMPMTVSIRRGRATTSSWFTNAVQVMDLSTGESLAIYHDLDHPVDALEIEPGVVLVAEQGRGRLLRLSGEQGEKRKTLRGDLPGMAALRALPPDDADDPVRYVYLTDTQEGKLLRIDVRDGSSKVIAAGLLQPEGFDLTPEGDIVLAEVGQRRLVRIDPEDGAVTEIARNLAIGFPAAAGTPPGYVQTGVGVSPSGAIYVSADRSSGMYKIVPQQAGDRH